VSTERVLGLLECPVCLLPPRAPPILQCPTGHLVCSECQPALARCPICNVRYRSTATRDFFAETLLDLLNRKCRHQHFGCEYRSKISAELVEHEAACQHRPTQPVKRKNKKDTNSNENEEGIDAEEDAEGDEEEEELEEDDIEEEEEEIEIEDIFISNFVFILVLLRAYVLEFVDGSAGGLESFSMEYLLLCLLCVWLYHAWQENGLHFLLDETSPFIAAWFSVVVVSLMVVRVVQQPWTGEQQLEDYTHTVSLVKPAITLTTGCFSSLVHSYVHNMREDNLLLVVCVLSLSALLSGAELFWSLQSSMDQFYYVLFWLQSFFIVLPFGLVGRNFMEF